MGRTVTAINPSRPNQAVYGPEVLATVPFFRDRAEYEAFTGEQAPPYRPDLPLKRWYVTDGVLDYRTYDLVSEPPTYKMVRVEEPELRSGVNFPGAYHYPAWVSPPSGAYYMLGGNREYIPNTDLASPEDAQRVVRELRDAGWSVEGLEENNRNNMFQVAFEPGEKRRMFMVVIAGQQYNVGKLITDQMENGIGAPGAWSQPGKGEPGWVPADTRNTGRVEGPEYPVPMRRLDEMERWGGTPFGRSITNVALAAGRTEVNEAQQADNVAETLRLTKLIAAKLDIE